MSPSSPFSRSSDKPLRPNIAPSTDQVEIPISPEVLIPRLGDYLIEKKLLSPEDLQRALDYQKANAIAGNPRLLGQILVELKLIDRSTLDQVITKQIVQLHNALQETNALLEQRVQERTRALERRLVQIRTAAEVTRLATRASSLSELLTTTVNRIVEQFGYYYAAIYLVGPQQKYAVLREATGEAGKELKERGYRLAIGSRSIIGWVTANNKARLVTDTREDDLYLQDELLPQTRSEICLPLAIKDEVVGALDVQSTSPQAFDEEDIVILQTLADQIASAIHHIRLLESAQINLQEIHLLYEASHVISRANTIEEIIENAASVFDRTDFLAATLVTEGERLRLRSLHDPASPENPISEEDQYLPYPLTDFQSALQGKSYLLITEFSQTTLPAALVHIPRQWGAEEVVYFPLWRQGKLEALFILGSADKGVFSDTLIQPYLSLTDLSTVALEKVDAIRGTQEQVSNLAVLNRISQAIATETELSHLYPVVHQQIKRVVGDVTFYIALYDARTGLIRIPYLYEDGEVSQVESLPVGEGLTSIVIREKKPLRIVEDTERKARELGAKQLGEKAAKSWLGVPLMVSGEVLGILNIQDPEQENAFSIEDERLLSTLAAQVAVSIRNAQLLSQARQQAERQRRLYDATEKVRAALDINSILETTSRELSQTLGAKRVVIELHPPDIAPSSHATPSEDTP